MYNQTMSLNPVVRRPWLAMGAVHSLEPEWHLWERYGQTTIKSSDLSRMRPRSVSSAARFASSTLLFKARY